MHSLPPPPLLQNNCKGCRPAALLEPGARAGRGPYGVFARFDLAALCGCHTFNVCYVMSFQAQVCYPSVLLQNSDLCTAANFYRPPPLFLQNNWDAAQQLFRSLELGQLGVRANAVTYNILMSGHLGRDQCAHVKALFDDMLRGHMAPTLVTFNHLITAYGRLGLWQEALAVLKHILR